MGVRRIFVEKKPGFDVEAQALLSDLKINLGIKGLVGLKIINRYDIEGISNEQYEKAKVTIFSEPPVDKVFDENYLLDSSNYAFAIEYLPGQYDQRADSASQCVQILTMGDKPLCRSARVIVLEGNISSEELMQIKNYCINPVEAREASMKKFDTLIDKAEVPEDVKVLEGFVDIDEAGIENLMKEMGFAMSKADIAFCQAYFRDTEKRNPTVTEIRAIDTYWSDHCRHTTFLTAIEEVEFVEGERDSEKDNEKDNEKDKSVIKNKTTANIIKKAYQEYLDSRKFVYGTREKDICLMDMATIAMKELKLKGELADLDESDEINACSIVVNADVDGKNEEWLVMFKNETHNHPTEIEPFGGAATCLGGAIRDPLSGRSYVYQAMRVTGSGDPRTKVEDTIIGKLPQRKITTGAAAGYSSYGNQIGLATGQVTEIYDEGFVAKRMEIGAVIGATPRKNVVRKKPEAGDVIILLGGRTGRDGCGGATGSSKEHDEESLATCGAEVQKGNPPTERKIQRLFRNTKVSSMIKKCNDFGAGGVSVAIGELADGLIIDLDAVPKKYDGLDGTELAISESQERMAVVIEKKNEEEFIKLAEEENLEATRVAVVTSQPRLVMKWRGNKIVDVSREFLDTNGAKQTTKVKVNGIDLTQNPLTKIPAALVGNLETMWLANLSRLNVCSQKGLNERFDSTIGAGSVLMPFGGKYQLTPTEGMAAKLPVEKGDTSTGTLMTFGYNPDIASFSPFHGAIYAVLEAVAKIVAMGGDYKKVRLTLQEYFERLGKDEEKWGKPFSALLGARHAQMQLGIPAIGGKDSMSGTFKDMKVPPTLVAFAVDTVDVGKVISPEFKKIGSKVILVKLSIDESGMPNFEEFKKLSQYVNKLISQNIVISAHSVKLGGVAEAVSKMCFGNKIGIQFDGRFTEKELFLALYGSIVLEIDDKVFDLENKQGLESLDYKVLGTTTAEEGISINGVIITLDEALQAWMKPLERIFPTKVEESRVMSKISENKSFEDKSFEDKCFEDKSFENKRFENENVKGEIVKRRCNAPKLAAPRIFIPVFPGTNCEYDTSKAFERAGGQADVFVIRNLTAHDIEASIAEMANRIEKAQIVMIPGGFSGGDEPDGSGKFIATAFRNPLVKEAVMKLLNCRDGLMLGICNGFQALIKLGLVPYGEIRDMEDNSPTLTYNTIGRHVSCMVNTKIVSTQSPWFNNLKVGDIHSIAVSHGEGRFTAAQEDIEQMFAKGQVATQYVNLEGNPTYDIRFNPNGSIAAIEGIISPDGRVLGKMGHSERMGTNIGKNVPGEKDQKIFEAGVGYFA